MYLVLWVGLPGGIKKNAFRNAKRFNKYKDRQRNQFDSKGFQVIPYPHGKFRCDEVHFEGFSYFKLVKKLILFPFVGKLSVFSHNNLLVSFLKINGKQELLKRFSKQELGAG